MNMQRTMIFRINSHAQVSGSENSWLSQLHSNLETEISFVGGTSPVEVTRPSSFRPESFLCPKLIMRSAKNSKVLSRMRPTQSKRLNMVKLQSMPLLTALPIWRNVAALRIISQKNLISNLNRSIPRARREFSTNGPSSLAPLRRAPVKVGLHSSYLLKNPGRSTDIMERRRLVGRWS